MSFRAAGLALASMCLASSVGIYMAACSNDTSVSPSGDGGDGGDGASPPADAALQDAAADAAVDAPFCPVGPITGSCESTASMGPSLYTRFCSDLIDTSRCVPSTGGAGSGQTAGSKVDACPTDTYLIGRCAYSTACRNDVNEYAYGLPGNPNNTVEKATAACAASGGVWQERADGGAWITK